MDSPLSQTEPTVGSAVKRKTQDSVVISGKLDLKKKSRELKQQIVSVNRQEFRELFGVRSADKWGSFVDCNLSAIVHSYADWARYPRGKHTVLEGRETKELTAVVISSDGFHVFSASRNGQIAVWDLTDNRMIGAWKAHTGYVKCLDYHCSGVLVSAGHEYISLWDGRNAALIRTFKGHTDWINSVAINEDGNRVVSGSYDNSIRLWSIKTGECLRQFFGHSESVTNVRLIGDVILSTAEDGFLKLWKLSESDAFKSIGKEEDEIDDISVNCDHSLVGLIRDYELIVYSWPKMKVFRRMDADAFYCCFHPCNPYLVALKSMDEEDEEEQDDYINVIRIYDVRNGECVSRLKHDGFTLNDLCFTPDGSRLIGINKISLHIWDVFSLPS